VLNNTFGKKFFSQCGAFGVARSWDAGGGNQWSGNVWSDGSGTVNP